jgi:type I restriction enzyme S subunit
MSKRISLAALVAEGALQVNDGYRTKAAELGPVGIPVLRVAEVLDGYLAPTYKDHVRNEFRAKMGAKTSRPKDVIVTTKGTVGRAAMMDAGLPEFVYSPQLCFLRVLDCDAVDPRWLYGWVRSQEFQQQAKRVAGQTDMAPYVNLIDLRNMQVTLPSIDQQRRAADVFGPLDDLIGAARRQIVAANGLLDALLPRLLTSEIQVSEIELETR